MQANRVSVMDRMIDRMPVGVRADLRESSDRLLSIRSPKAALHAVEHEYEHALRLILPVVIAHPTLRRRASAAAFSASFATLAASAEQADELLSVVSVGTLTAPGTSVVVAVGLLATAAESYAAASVRVHQLREHQRPVDADRLAGDVRRAVLGEVDTSTAGFGLVKQIVDGAAGRLTRRWTVGAVPVFGVGYAAYDATRSVRRVLQTPLPDAVIGELAPVESASVPGVEELLTSSVRRVDVARPRPRRLRRPVYGYGRGMSASRHGRARIGCSGWVYTDWRGVVYPVELRQAEWFSYYATQFDTVEIDNTFYRLPTSHAVEKWAAQAPPGFEYAVKVGQFGSHRKKLLDPTGWLPNHLDRVRRLGVALGPNLVQLPPRWKRNTERLDEFLATAPRDLRWAVEIRDPSWLHDDVFAALERHGAALCIHDMLADHPWILTTGWTYVRFHGPDAIADKYRGHYGSRRLVRAGAQAPEVDRRGRRRLRILQQRLRGARGDRRSSAAPRPRPR